MSEGGSRRAVAEIRFGEDRSGLTKVGGRSIHQYWSLLSPHFRDVLLAPQRRSDDGGVAWTWREALDKKPLTASELAGVRKRLERGNESFAENPVNPLMGDDRSGTSSQALIDQVAAKVKAMAESLAAKSDAALADFVCRTETGAMVHSWGVVSPASIYYPDALDSGVSGVVLVGGKPSSAGYEVVVENAQGLSVARTQSDEAGEFLFSKIAPGRYRVRVTSGRMKFPAKGVPVTVERGVMTRLELASTTNPDEPDKSTIENADEPPSVTSPGNLSSDSSRKRGGPGKTVAVLLLVLLLGSGGVWAWRSWSTSEKTGERIVAQSSSMTPEAFADGDKKAISSRLPANTGDDSRVPSATVDGVGGEKSWPTHSMSAENFETPRATISGREHTTATIGSKIEVLSGVAGSQGAGAVTTSGVNGPSSSTLMGQSPEQRSIDGPGKMVQGMSSVVTPPPKTGKNIRVVVADPSAAGASSEAGLPGSGSGSLEINNTMPGENQAGAINDTLGRKAAGDLATESGDAKAEGEAAQEGGSLSGSPTAETAQDTVTVGKANSGQPQIQGPKAMTSVVEKKLSGEKQKPTANANEPHLGEAAPEAEKKTASVPRSAAKREQSAVMPGSASSHDGATISTPSEGASGEKSALPGDRLPANTPAGSQAEPKAGENAKPVEKNPEPVAKITPDEATVSGAMSGEDLREVKIEIRVPVWKNEITRDAIVPTLPVLISESDAAELSRNILLAEKRKLLPETFRSPVIHYGIELQVDPALGSQPMAWTAMTEDRAAMQGSVQGNRVELVWLAGTAGEGKRVLKNAEGVAVARVIFTRDGVIRLELVGKTRAIFWIGVARSPRDGAAAKDQKPGRFAWQVVRGVAPHLSWRDDAVWPGGRGLRLEVALNNKPVSRTMVAIVDRLTGWSFSGEL